MEQSTSSFIKRLETNKLIDELIDMAHTMIQEGTPSRNRKVFEAIENALKQGSENNDYVTPLQEFVNKQHQVAQATKPFAEELIKIHAPQSVSINRREMMKAGFKYAATAATIGSGMMVYGFRPDNAEVKAAKKTVEDAGKSIAQFGHSEKDSKELSATANALRNMLHMKDKNGTPYINEETQEEIRAHITHMEEAAKAKHMLGEDRKTDTLIGLAGFAVLVITAVLYIPIAEESYHTPDELKEMQKDRQQAAKQMLWSMGYIFHPEHNSLNA